VGGFTTASAEEVGVYAALLTALATLLSAIATLLYYTTELRFRRGSRRHARAGSPGSPPGEPPGSGGQPAGPPTGGSGGGVAAGPPPQQSPVQTWTGTSLRARTTGLPRPIAPRPGPVWWAQHTVRPSNGWAGNVRTGPPQTPPAPSQPVSGLPLPWWRNVQVQHASEGASERSST
jgi:hypothetical protein